MMTARRLLATCLAVSSCGMAAAATIPLAGGGRLTVTPTTELVMPGLTGGGRVANQASGAHGGGLVYVLVDGSGRSWSGTIPGTKGQVIGEPSLAQNPLTSEIFAAFARRDGGEAKIAFSSWLGDAWTEPQALTSGDGDDTEPVLSFGESGEAVLSWLHDDRLPTVLVRNFELASTGPVVNHSFSDLGAPSALVRAAGGILGLRDGLAHGLTDSWARRTYLFVADAERGEVGLVRLNLEALYQGGGFNAPPVPVAVMRPAPQSAGSAGLPVGERRGDEPASLILPWRLALTSDVVAYYWTESDRLALVLFRDGAGGRLVSVLLPADEAQVHAAAYHAALREMGVERRSTERMVQRRR